jgi:hypothetical protein
MNLEEEILELLRREGSVTVYRIAKTFGLTYGTAQWYVSKFERSGFVHTVRIGTRQYVAIKGDHCKRCAGRADAGAFCTRHKAGNEPQRGFGEAGNQSAPPGRDPPPNCATQMSCSLYVKTTASLCADNYSSTSACTAATSFRTSRSSLPHVQSVGGRCAASASR